MDYSPSADDLLTQLLGSDISIPESDLSSDHQAAVDNMARQFPNAEAVVQKNTGASQPPAVNQTDPSQHPDVQALMQALQEKPEDTTQQTKKSDPMANLFPTLGNSPNGIAILQQLQNQYLNKTTQGGQYSIEGENEARNNLAPINSAMAFGQNQMMGAGTPGGLRGSPAIPGTVASNPMNADYANQKASELANMNTVSGIGQNQMSMAAMSQLADPSSPVSKIYLDLASRVLGQQLPSGIAPMQLFTLLPPDKVMTQLTAGLTNAKTQADTMKALAEANKTNAEANPTSLAALEAAKASGTQSGKTSVGASTEATNVAANTPAILSNLKTLKDMNDSTPSGPTDKIEKLSGLSQGKFAGDMSAKIGTWKSTVANNILGEISQMQNAMANPDSTATPAIRTQMVKIAEEAKAIDVSLSPQDRLARINAVENSVKQMMNSADYKAWALGGNQPPSMNDLPKSNNTSTPSVTKWIMGPDGKLIKGSE